MPTVSIAKASVGSTWASFTIAPATEGTFHLALASGNLAVPLQVFDPPVNPDEFVIDYDGAAVTGLSPSTAYKVQFYPTHGAPTNVVTFVTRPYSDREAVYDGLGPLAWYRMDDSSYGTLRDSGPNGAHMVTQGVFSYGPRTDPASAGDYADHGPRRPSMDPDNPGYSMAWQATTWAKTPHQAWMERDRANGWVIVARCYANGSGLRPLMSYGNEAESGFAWTIYAGPVLAIDAADGHYVATGAVPGFSFCVFLISETRFAIWQDGILVLDVEPAPHYVPPRLSIPAHAEDNYELSIAGYASYGFFYGTSAGATDYEQGNLDEVAVYPLLTDAEIAQFFDPPAADTDSDCPKGLQVTFFYPDDVTPIWGSVDELGELLVGSFYSSPGCPRAYMKVPTDLSDARVDFINGAASVGGLNLQVLDVRRVANDQSTGIITSHLMDLVDARALVRKWVGGTIGWAVVLDGVVKGHRTLADKDLVWYEFSLRDIRERERGRRLFTRNESLALWPYRGPADGYGVVGNVPGPGEGYLYPPIFTPMMWHVGTFHVHASDPYAPATQVRGWASATSTVNQLAKDVLDAGIPVMGGDLAQGTLQGRYKNVTVRWRPHSGGDWHYLRDMLADSLLPTNLFSAFNLGLYNTNLGTGDFGGIIYTASGPLQLYMESSEPGEMPADGQEIDVQVLTGAPPTKDQPFYFEGTGGQLLKNAYDGVYSRIDPRIRYDAAVMDDLVENTPVLRMKLTESVDNMFTWLQSNVYAPLGLAPVLNELGEISPISNQLPDSSADLLVLDGDAIEKGAVWQHDINSAVSTVEFNYVRESVADVFDEKHRYTGVEITERQATAIETLLSGITEKTVTYSPVTVRVYSDRNGQPLPADLRDEVGARLAHARAADLLMRYRKGAARVPCRALAGHPSVKDARVGQWRRLQLSWLPDPDTGLRGCDRIVQIVGLKRTSGALYDLVLEDGGAALPPLACPTLGVPAIDAAGRIGVPITAIPAGATARIEYAFGLGPPAANSPSWMLAGRASLAPTTVYTGVIPSERTTWIRYRSEADVRQPSAWCGPVMVGPSNLPRIASASIVRVGDTGRVVVDFTTNLLTEAVEVYADVHELGTTATLVLVGWATPATGTFEFWADPLPPYTLGMQLDVQLVPYAAAPPSGAPGPAWPLQRLLTQDGSLHVLPFWNADDTEDDILLIEGDQVPFTSADGSYSTVPWP